MASAVMRAIVITKPGGPDVLEEQIRPIPDPGYGQVRVRIRASALNRADVMQRGGNYPPPSGASADIPGLEYAGEVEALGPGTSLWRPGARVMGIVGGGGHSEFVTVHEREAIAVPTGMSWEVAAAIPEVFLTAYDALFLQLKMKIGERLLIHAVGSGVGTAALQLARSAGIMVLGTSRSADKITRARALGLEVGIVASTADWTAGIEKATGRAGVHAVLDLVGGKYLDGNLRVLAPRGRMILVGHVSGAKAELNLAMLISKRIQLMGTVLRSRPLEEKISLARAFTEHVLPLFAAGKLKPVVDRVYSFADIKVAHRQMESDSSFGKIVLRWD
jgi:putative PIG3 family NAD(P)H quinone oxidoreductase